MLLLFCCPCLEEDGVPAAPSPFPYNLANSDPETTTMNMNCRAMTSNYAISRRPPKTRPSALGMSDPILGPLIHIFELKRKRLLDQIDYEYAALLF